MRSRKYLPVAAGIGLDDDLDLDTLAQAREPLHRECNQVSVTNVLVTHRVNDKPRGWDKVAGNHNAHAVKRLMVQSGTLGPKG